MSKFVEQATQTAMLFFKSSTVILKFTPPKKEQFVNLLRASAKTGVPCKIKVVGDEVFVDELEEKRFPPWLIATQLKLERQRKKRLTH